MHQKNMVLWLGEHLGHALPYRSKRLTLACTHFFMEIYVNELSNHTGYSGRAEKRKQSNWEGMGCHYLRHLSFANKCILMIETTLSGGKNSRGYHEEIINCKQQNFKGGT